MEKLVCDMDVGVVVSGVEQMTSSESVCYCPSLRDGKGETGLGVCLYSDLVGTVVLSGIIV